MTSTATDQITGFSGSLAVKQPVRLATLVDIVLEGLIAIDGIVPAEGDRVLVKAQATPSQNGIYIASTGVWSRAADFDATGKGWPAALEQMMKAFARQPRIDRQVRGTGAEDAERGRDLLPALVHYDRDERLRLRQIAGDTLDGLRCGVDLQHHARR